MNKISEEQLGSFIEAGHETRNLEYKPGFAWNQNGNEWLTEKIIQTILAMTNTPSGGYVILGIEEKDDKYNLKGVSDEHLKTYSDFDRIKGQIDGFTYSSTEFDLSWGEYQGNKFVVFAIQEFYEWPVVCRHNGKKVDLLRKDDIYARSRRSPYGSIRATELELREIIKLAIKKEKVERGQQGWIQRPEVNAESFYKRQVKDLT